MSTRINGIVGPYRKSPGLILPELKSVRAICKVCNTANEISWNEDLEHPRQPIEANDGRMWIPVSFPVPCKCGTTINFEIPKKPLEGSRTFYGDEAHRVIKTNAGEVSFFCITLIGMHPEARENFKTKLLELKSSIRPSEDPETWTYHTTDIWSTHPDLKKYSLTSVPEKISHMKSFARLIKETRPYLTSLNVSSAIMLPDNKTKRAEQLMLQRDDIFKQATLSSLEILRRSSMGINWIYDNTKDTSTGERTEGWADECFLGLQHNRQFIYLTAHANITRPSFVKPGSHHLLEVADFMSFWLAREFFKSIQKQTTEIKCSLMGLGLYQRTARNGDAISFECNGSDAVKQYFRNT